ncbi:MAG: alpha/beta hydrolase, partial [Cephaloticoccus sp.]
VALLTVRPAPVWVPWKLALLAGEFGHRLVGLPLVVGVGGAWLVRAAPVPAVASMLAGAAALALFLKPVWQARRLARQLPARLAAAFGAVPRPLPAFRWRGLLARPARPVTRTTRTFAPGLNLDLYRDADAPHPLPCMVVVHGGGWDGGDRDELAGFNHWLARQGVVVAAVDYRLAPAHGWPAAGDDVQAALKWLQAQADECGIDPENIFLLGRSAGGQIVAAVGFALGTPAVRGVIALYAPHDMAFAWGVSREDDALNSLNLMRQYLGGPPDLARADTYLSASAQYLVGPATPPTLLLHGTLDTLVWRRHSERLAAALAAAGRPHLLLELPWATHAFEYHLAGPGGQLTACAVRWFLEATRRH